MKISAEQIKLWITEGEYISMEFKRSRKSLSRSVFDSICAMLNRAGGHILLGVEDDGTIEGVEDAKGQQATLIKDMNNEQLIRPAIFMHNEIVSVTDDEILRSRRMYQRDREGIITPQSIMSENANRPRYNTHITVDQLLPFPKNPIIASVFREMGWIDEVGAGAITFKNYCPLFYAGLMPEIEDGDDFRCTLKLYKEGTNQDGLVNEPVNSTSNQEGDQGDYINDGVNSTSVQESVQELNEKQKTVLAFCATPKSATEILEHLGLSIHSKNKQTYISTLINAGLLSMTIPEVPNDRRQKYLTVKK